MSFPPQKSLPSQPISQIEALTHLQTYLALAKTAPYLLPNARLEPSGPSSGSSANNVTMHNLERVEAGLRGELWFAPVDFSSGVEEDKGKVDEMEWQDKEEFEREQQNADGSLPPQPPDVALVSHEKNAGKDTKIDKEARKIQKKLRRQQEAKDRAEKLVKDKSEE